MRIAVAVTGENAGVLQRIEQGAPVGPRERTDDLAGTVARYENGRRPRWVWADTASVYGPLVRRGVRVERSYDVELADAVLRAYAGRWESRPAEKAGDDTLFDTGVADRIGELLDRLAGQDTATPGPPAYEPSPVTPRRLDLLLAADCAGGLAAAEMSHAGLPWNAEIHDRLLTEALGPRPRGRARPARLQALADEIAHKLGVPHLNPDSPAELIKAFARNGITLESTRAHALQRIEHPAVGPLLTYKGLARLHTANGWAWRETWATDGRFRPEYVPAAVVSGRWATRGGGALQIPKAVRAAAVADPGWRLVVADAAQLEPRILAALSRDAAMTEAAAHGDLYRALADQSFHGERRQAKVGLLSAMYGGASPALGTMRRDYPAALAMVEDAARAGESGRLVRSVLGRTCPPPGDWGGLSETQVLRRARDRGRFTRNFVIQASAADWAGVLLALVRARLPDGELVFFCHDEIVVHAPESATDAVAAAIDEAAVRATRLVFGETPVRLPLTTAVVENYAAAKDQSVTGQ